jgi:hypothetical protein
MFVAEIARRRGDRPCAPVMAQEDSGYKGAFGLLNTLIILRLVSRVSRQYLSFLDCE